VRLVLASASPQRRKLLEAAGYEFEIEPADVEEASVGFVASELARHNASIKARAVANQAAGAVVIGADTVVALGDVAYGKPASHEAAAAMLASLGGQTHQVHSAVCVVIATADGMLSERSGLRTTSVRFKPLSECQITAHLALGEWQGRAGGYAFQESGHDLVEAVDGAVDTVIGMPMGLLSQLLPESVQP